MSLLKGRVQTRAIIWVMLFTCTLFLYMIRINLSIIILAMVEPSRDANHSISIPECSYRETNRSSLAQDTEEDFKFNDTHRFEWDTKLQGVILGAYFWGFVISAIPGGALAERFGPKLLVSISFVVSGGLTLLGPLASHLHPSLLIASRFLIGLFGGVVYPSMHCLVSKWAPPNEKGKFMSALLGGALGTIITWPLLGKVLEVGGWRWGFYVSGSLVLIWTALWVFLVADLPEKHRWISKEEMSYIVGSLDGNVVKTKKLPPYKYIFLSVPVWALVFLHFGNLWGLFFLMTAGPNFMSTVLGFNLGHTGILASLPYLARMLSGFAFGAIGDAIMRKGLMTKTAIRKSFVIFSHVIPGLLLLVQTFVGCRIEWSIVLITASLGFNGASTITNLQNSQDLAPNYAGTIYGIINSIGSVTGFISPLIVGYMTSEHNGLDEWHKIFYIGSSVYIGCGIIFCLLGSGEIQPWNHKEKQKGKTEGVENTAFDAKSETIVK